MRQPTLFERLLAGELPCHLVYQSDLVFAILDIAPMARGHTLVIPKEPATTMGELSEQSAAALGRALPIVCRAMLRATGASDYNLLQNNGSLAGQVVPHVHVHVIPKASAHGGLAVQWTPGTLAQSDARALCAAYALALGSHG